MARLPLIGSLIKPYLSGRETDPPEKPWRESTATETMTVQCRAGFGARAVGIDSASGPGASGG
jgi:hypothetical protein